MVVATAIVFVASLLLGAAGIYVGARIIVGANDFDHAIVTALLGAIVWAVATALLDWIPLVGSLIGPLVALVAYVGVIKWRYGTEWTAAAMIGVLAWLVVAAVLYVLTTLGIPGLDALGVPGTGG